MTNRRGARTHCIPRFLCAAMLFILAGAKLALAKGLADLVPADVGICVEGRELSTQTRAFFAGPLGKRLLKHHAVEAWSTARGGDVGQLTRDLEAHFQMPIAELFDGVAGYEVLLGVWPESTPKGEDAPALLLVHAKNADTLRKAWDAIYGEQERSGHGAPQVELTIAGERHAIRVIKPEGEEKLLFLAVSGDVGLLSNAQPLISGALERQAELKRSPRSDAPAQSLAGSPAYQAVAARLPQDATIRWFVNARAWDPLMVRSIESDSDEELSTNDREKLIASWRGTEYLAGSATLGDSLHLEVAWHADAAKLPAAAREVAEAVSGEAGFFEFVPNDALVAVAGRAQWGRLARLVWGELAAGADASDDATLQAAAGGLLQLAEKLGPDCGAFVTAAPEKDPEKLPLELAFGLETRARLPREIASTATDSFDQSFRGALALVTVLYNQDHTGARAQLTMERVDGVSLTTLSGIKELGDVRPTYTMTANGVLVGTSPQAVREAVSIPKLQSLGRSARITNVLQGTWENPSQVLYLDVRGLRELFATHPGFESHLRKRAGAKLPNADRGVHELQGLLNLADTVVGAARVEPGDLAAVLDVSAE